MNSLCRLDGRMLAGMQDIDLQLEEGYVEQQEQAFRDTAGPLACSSFKTQGSLLSLWQIF